MKKNIITYFVALVAVASIIFKIATSHPTITKENFDILEGKGTHFWKKLTADDMKELEFYKELYLRNLPLCSALGASHRIPKVIHYIWVGPEAFPKSSISYVKSWIDNNKGWTIKFWTDDPDREPPIEGMEKHLITEIPSEDVHALLTKTDNYGEQSDILRYAILAMEGGIYVDHDIECFHSFLPLVQSLDFFAGLEPPHHNKGIASSVVPCNAIIGAIQGHPIVLRSMQQVKQRWDEVENRFTGQDATSRMLKVFHRTFYSFSLAVKEAIDTGNYRDIIFPASFFYPDRIVRKEDFENWKKQGLIWASHKYAGEWKPRDSSSDLREELEKEKKDKRFFKRKYKFMRNLAYINSIIVLAGCLILVARKRRSRETKGF